MCNSHRVVRWGYISSNMVLIETNAAVSHHLSENVLAAVSERQQISKLNERKTKVLCSVSVKKLADLSCAPSEPGHRVCLWTPERVFRPARVVGLQHSGAFRRLIPANNCCTHCVSCYYTLNVWRHTFCWYLEHRFLDSLCLCIH